MALAAIEEQKICTSRNKKYGKPGDVFFIVDPRDGGRHKFKLTQIRRFSLYFVAHALYREEGFDNSAGFTGIWERLHPRKGYDPAQFVITHFFEKVRV